MKPHYLWTPNGPVIAQRTRQVTPTGDAGRCPEQIKAAMRMKGITQTALSEQLHVAKSTVSQVISGRSVSARVQGRIAEIIGKSVSEIWPKENQRPVLRRTRAAIAADRAC